jgi:hypothetical protein
MQIGAKEALASWTHQESRSTETEEGEQRGAWKSAITSLVVALRRGYGECRMVESDAPELKSIGDAREVINIQRAYQLGDMVWSGPGPYR